MLDLLARKGNEHEAKFLAQLKEKYGVEKIAIINTETPRNRQADAEATLAAMQAGYPVIFQAYLIRDQFAGSADFLIKKPGQSNFGDYYYEAWDTKLAKSNRPYFIMQLCCYSWMLEVIQGVLPEEAVVVQGDLKENRFRLASYFSYFERLKSDFLASQLSFKAQWPQMPDPAFAKDYGRWGTFAKQSLEQQDSLSLVANIRKSQIKKLQDGGIKTLTALAQTEQASIKVIPKLTFDKLKAQALIQLDSRGKERPEFKVISSEAGNGLSLLPPASALDVFFDIEGHPLVDGGLEYLWGVSYKDTQAAQGKQYVFKDWWAHTAEQEKAAFEGFMDWAYARWQADPNMHIYHYASYEVTAMRKLSNRYETRIKEVADLQANNVLVDLYRIVQAGLLVGEPKYSIKNIEHLYRERRTTDVATGGDSVVAYEKWLEQGGVERWCSYSNGYQRWRQQPEQFEWSQWPELKAIRDYNIDDCESTLELVDWLREQQQNAGIVYKLKQDETEKQKELTERQLKNAERKQEILDRQNALIQRFQENEALKLNPSAKLAIELMGFHNRERKPKIWTYFERLEKNDDELFADDTCLHNITIVGSEQSPKGLLVKGQFDASQPLRTDKFARATIRGTELTVKADISFLNDGDNKTGHVEFVVPEMENQELPKGALSLFAEEGIIPTDKLEERLCDMVESLFDGKATGAINSILAKAAPNFNEVQNYLPITRKRYPDDDAYLNAMIKAVQSMDHSCLCIQGPPGAGKTSTAKDVIAALVRQDKRIGILSNSHAAILNLLDEVYHVTQGQGFRVAKIGGLGSNQTQFREKYPEEHYPNYCYRTSMSFTTREPYGSFSVIGATVFAFASDIAFEHPLDYLFVDEASQVALANLVAVAGAAKNIVLMGDQMQLEQPTQGAHPDNAGASALEYLLDGHSVIPEAKGIFLERTYRMHPDVCRPLSEVVYEGKLNAAEGNEKQRIEINNPKKITKSHGILVVKVNHNGNQQSSGEEARVVAELVDELKTGCFHSKTGESSQITGKDILIVSPYNMQVNLLKDRIPSGCAIGTIDKFQGQQAPVVIISMAVSDVEESPRGMEFIFNINRLNVAISRAKALAIIVVNEGLEKCDVTNIKQIENLNFFCRLLDG
jgi:predicted RecB family nuclease